jgi:hypothetical protein
MHVKVRVAQQWQQVLMHNHCMMRFGHPVIRFSNTQCHIDNALDTL